MDRLDTDGDGKITMDEFIDEILHPDRGAATAIGAVEADIELLSQIDGKSIPGAQMYYTLDGSLPSVHSSLFESTIRHLASLDPLENDAHREVRVRAMVHAPGYLPSAMAEKTIQIPSIHTPEVEVQPTGGSRYKLRLTCETLGATIYYTTGYGVPTMQSELYGGKPVHPQIPKTAGALVVRARAFLDGVGSGVGHLRVDLQGLGMADLKSIDGHHFNLTSNALWITSKGSAEKIEAMHEVIHDEDALASAYAAGGHEMPQSQVWLRRQANLRNNDGWATNEKNPVYQIRLAQLEQANESAAHIVPTPGAAPHEGSVVGNDDDDEDLTASELARQEAAKHLALAVTGSDNDAYRANQTQMAQTFARSRKGGGKPERGSANAADAGGSVPRCSDPKVQESASGILNITCATSSAKLWFYTIAAQEAASSNQRGNKPTVRLTMAELIDVFNDANAGVGKSDDIELCKMQFGNALKDPRVLPLLRAANLTANDTDWLFDHMDKNGDGVIKCIEFIKLGEVEYLSTAASQRGKHSGSSQPRRKASGSTSVSSDTALLYDAARPPQLDMNSTESQIVVVMARKDGFTNSRTVIYEARAGINTEAAKKLQVVREKKSWKMSFRRKKKQGPDAVPLEPTASKGHEEAVLSALAQEEAANQLELSLAGPDNDTPRANQIQIAQPFARSQKGNGKPARSSANISGAVAREKNSWKMSWRRKKKQRPGAVPPEPEKHYSFTDAMDGTEFMPEASTMEPKQIFGAFAVTHGVTAPIRNDQVHQATFKVDLPLGVLFADEDGAVVISRVDPGGNSYTAGVKQGMAIASINGTSMIGMPKQQVEMAIRRQARVAGGTSCILGLMGTEATMATMA